ncbi:uncharacterized protein F4822DRAFT_419589 [Hypoxylon trugodes]|uniref:uncharacterized protein n=1 Tax=Hypoxylon trugodes TaxID=326681 RepID=UPI00219D7275|nr:uncharacterized protein F4822DRAFT_419589 [Hypoxylon trugodes]KAI1383193.1 hypothetical protein F4822DRAFT_419589 [Hypoxylon trugodes]
MLSSIGRAAIRRLGSTSIVASPRRIVVSRLADNCGREFVRTFAAARTKNSVTATASTKPATTKGPSKTSTKTSRSIKLKATKTTKTTKATKGKAKKTTRAKAKPRAKATPKRKKKELTPEKKAAVERRELRKTALFTEPKPLPHTPWVIFVTEQTKDKHTQPSELREKMKQLGQTYHTLSSSELQRYADVAEQNKRNNSVAYKAWLESHKPQQISSAINARYQLKKKYNVPKGQIKTIHDDRLPKRPLTSYVLYAKARWASGDFANRPIIEATQAISHEWKSLSSTERQAYDDLAKASRDQYEKEVQSVLNRSVRKPSPKS